MKQSLKYLNDFAELFFPRLCACCSGKLLTGETNICTYCISHFPKTHFLFEKDNKIEQLFWGRVKIERATSFLFFTKGSSYQQLLHHIKYNGMKELARTLGRHFGADLFIAPHFSSVDCIIPVPLHPRKHKKRGYNQCDWIAFGLSDILTRPVIANNLKRIRNTDTQTRKNRYERWENVEGIFETVNTEELKHRHVLLIDDVLTTGATLEAAATALLKVEGVKVSIATLAFAE